MQEAVEEPPAPAAETAEEPPAPAEETVEESPAPAGPTPPRYLPFEERPSWFPHFRGTLKQTMPSPQLPMSPRVQILVAQLGGIPTDDGYERLITTRTILRVLALEQGYKYRDVDRDGNCLLPFCIGS